MSEPMLNFSNLRPGDVINLNNDDGPSQLIVGIVNPGDLMVASSGFYYLDEEEARRSGAQRASGVFSLLGSIIAEEEGDVTQKTFEPGVFVKGQILLILEIARSHSPTTYFIDEITVTRDGQVIFSA